MFIVYEEGGDYDWSDHTNLFLVETEELAKVAVSILEKEKREVLKLPDPYLPFNKSNRNAETVMDWHAENQKRNVVFNNAVKKICKLYPIEWDDRIARGDYVIKHTSDWHEHYSFGFHKIEIKGEEILEY